MNQPLVSIILPGIRKENWNKLYQSIYGSLTNKTFELIIVGPEENKDLNKSNIKFLKSFQTPVCCQQLGAEIAIGKYIIFASDDRNIC